ncbi:MAG TPA: NADH-ubiquinone oxidoreductase-F iron-sulfur binding region domain-containing protein, partial [Methyloradius sp.]
ICALGDAAATPVLSFIKHFRPEFEYYIQHGHSMVDAQQNPGKYNKQATVEVAHA